jgi:YggT family protein
MNETFLVFLIYFVTILVNLVTYLVFARVVLSWLRPAPNKLTRFIFYSTEPIMDPFRRFVPTIGPFDISPIVCLLTISFLGGFIITTLASLA